MNIEDHPKPMHENVRKQWFSENLDYLNLSDKSIWGKPSPITIQKAREIFRHGLLCELGAGDARYTLFLRTIANVIALDVDLSALMKNKRTIKTKLKKPLRALRADLVKAFPFENNSLYAVFSSAILHLFKPRTFKNIAKEIDRTMKPGGKMLLEFPIDIRRTNLKTGKPLSRIGKEESYTRKRATALMISAFPNFEINIEKGSRIQRKFRKPKVPYQINCTNLLVTGIKRNIKD